jgi:hypothetical protein
LPAREIGISVMISRINQDYIDSFSERLKSILNNEIKLGNKILWTEKDWPYKNGIAILLNHQFSHRYHLFPGIEYEEINNPHYWKAQYFDSSTKHILACNFFMPAHSPTGI